MIDEYYRIEYINDAINFGVDIDYSAIDKPTFKYFLNLKKFRLYKVFFGIPTLFNFNNNNDIIPWIIHKFNKLKNRIFPIKFIEDEITLVDKFINGRKYKKYQIEKSPVIQVIKFIPDGRIRDVYRVNYNNLTGFIKEGYEENFEKLVKGHKEAGTLIDFSESNIEKIKELCYKNRKK